MPQISPLPVFAPKNYNFESNSQPKLSLIFLQLPCFRAEKLQFWKQFTTCTLIISETKILFSRRKITILKAIHNYNGVGRVLKRPVFAPKNYNFESNSQLWFYYYWPANPCFRAEKLQFWKQFTTSEPSLFPTRALFSRRKITILKAIHNKCTCRRLNVRPVFAPKNYNFESNSQLSISCAISSGTCFRAEKLQFWKQFTTAFQRARSGYTCFRAEKLQFWKQFTTLRRAGYGRQRLFSRRKITILKAIHNCKNRLLG